MNAAPELDVVIVNYNSGQALEQCLIELIDDEAKNTNVFVIDNNCMDYNYILNYTGFYSYINI